MSPLNDYGHAYFHCSPDGLVRTDGILLVGRDRPKMSPSLVNCYGQPKEAILYTLKAFIRGA